MNQPARSVRPPARQSRAPRPCGRRISRSSPGCGAWRGVPSFRVRLFLELRADDERLTQVLLIVDDGRHNQQFAAASRPQDVEVLRDGGALAVGHTVLTEI